MTAGSYVLRISPNPATETVRIEYAVLKSCDINLTVYDACGKVVKEFDLSLTKPVIWNFTDEYGRKMPAGVYFVQLKCDDFQTTEKIVLLK
jgi:hypothetical protein